jgi:hypothetical protein
MSQTESLITTHHAWLDDLSETAQYELLADERRKTTIEVLSDRCGTMGLRTIADDVARQDAGIDAGNQEAVDRVATRLHHVHLPKLDDAGLLEYEPTTQTVTL